MKLSYRDRVKLLGGAGLGIGLKASGLASLAGWAGASLAQGDAGGTLRWALTPEPPTLALDCVVMRLHVEQPRCRLAPQQA